MTMRNRVMHLELAKRHEEVEKRLTEWKANVRKLADLCPKDPINDNEQLKTILINIMPDNIAEYLAQRCKDKSYDQLEEELIEYLDRIDQRKVNKKIGSVSTKENENPDTSTAQWYYDENTKDWAQYLCLATPAMKRQRTDDAEDNKPLAPAGGCFTCGGPHYAAECPDKPKGKGKGKDGGKGKGKGKGGKGKGGKGEKGKGKGDKGKGKGFPSQAQWQDWKPPWFRPVQWNDWRPQNTDAAASKGKGKGATLGLSFPPLCAVTPNTQEAGVESWSQKDEEWWWSEDNGYDGGFIGVVSRKAAKVGKDRHCEVVTKVEVL